MHHPKRIIICCDGTWNEPDIDPTNVVKLVRCIQPTAADGTQQVVFYNQGVGTGSKVDRMVGGALGKGVAKNVRDCYRFLVHNYEDQDEIYCFGFSRGAYTARAFAGLVSAIGIMNKSGLEELPKAYQYYRTPPDERPNAIYDQNPRPDIRMIGVWDTVGALGAPTPLLGRLTTPWVGFFDTHLSPIVKHAYHALALDERRAAFSPDLWTGIPTDDQVIEQCWFRGAHSDVGGGYKETGLSDIALLWMVEKAEALGLEFDHRYLDRLTEPNPVMASHDSYSTLYRLMGLIGPGEERRYLRGSREERPINVTVHESVMAAIDAGTYKPRNPDFPVPQIAGAERRDRERFDPRGVVAFIKRPADAAPVPCTMVDFSMSGIRIETDQPLHPGDSVIVRSDLFDASHAICVWEMGRQHGLRFADAA